MLLRESYRENGKTRKRTLANLSTWPMARVEQLRAVLRGEALLPASEAIEVVRSLPHGHVLAAARSPATNGNVGSTIQEGLLRPLLWPDGDHTTPQYGANELRTGIG